MTNSNDYSRLKQMKDPELLSAAYARVSAEKNATLAVLYCLREIEHRRLHIARGFQSLFDFVTRELGYSPAAAQRRILAMRLLREIPVLETKIEQGLMTLDTAARAQGFFKQEQKSGGHLSLESKKEVLSQLEGKSSRECERVLASQSSRPEAFLRPDSIKPVGRSSVEVRFVADDGLMTELARLRELLSHKNPSMSMAELIAEMARVALAELDPARSKKAGAKISESKPSEDPIKLSQSIAPTQEALAMHCSRPIGAHSDLKKPPFYPAPDLKPELKPELKPTLNAEAQTRTRTQSRYIPLRTRREVLGRDGYRCTYLDALTGRRCESRFQLELDHWRIPFAQGGDHSASNLKTVCRNHNQWRTIETYGALKMSRFQGGSSR